MAHRTFDLTRALGLNYPEFPDSCLRIEFPFCSWLRVSRLCLDRQLSSFCPQTITPWLAASLSKFASALRLKNWGDFHHLILDQPLISPTPDERKLLFLFSVRSGAD
jgi:hypothetical protein